MLGRAQTLPLLGVHFNNSERYRAFVSAAGTIETPAIVLGDSA
jgi:hypothetical protein